MKRTISLALITLVVICAFTVIDGALAQSPSKENRIDCEVEVEIFDLNVSSRNSTVVIKVSLRNETLSYPTVKVLISGGGSAEFYCGSSISENEYYGESNATAWRLVSFGEFFPFDFYYLEFWVQQVYIRNDSDTPRFEDKVVLSTASSGRVFPSYNADALKALWYTSDDLGHLPVDVKPDRKMSLQITRNSSNAANYALLFPLIAAFVLLGASLALNTCRLRERLTIYVALFAFSPAFLFSIQSYLPFHTSLTILEFLIVALMVSVAAYGFSGIVSQLFRQERSAIVADAWAIVLSGLTFAVLYYSLYLQAFLFKGTGIPLGGIATLLLLEFFGYILAAWLIGVRLMRLRGIEQVPTPPYII